MNSNVKQEDNPIIPLQYIKYLKGSEIIKFINCICKIITTKNTGTGFFVNIPEKKIKIIHYK